MILGFKKKTSSGLTITFHESNHEAGWNAVFQLLEGNNIIPVNEWQNLSHSGALWLVDFTRMNDIVQNSLDTIVLPFEKLMKELEGQEGYIQRILCLPQFFDGGINIESKGLLHSENYRINYNWINSNGRQIIQSERHGGIIIIGNKKYLLPVHAWKMAECLDILSLSIENSNNVYSRLQVLEEIESLKNLLPEAEKNRISESSEIAGLKLYYANSFRIEAIPENRSYKIRPVLLKRQESKDGISAVFESILPPSEQIKYADYFSNSTNLLPYYNLGVGKYLILSDQLNKVLSVVHKVQHGSPEERVNFLKNPKASIAESLDGIIEEEDLNKIFSDRVIGIGDWNSKVIPWMQLPANEWIPEGELPNVRKGIDIDGKKIELTIEQASKLLDKVEKAKSSGAPFIEYEGIQIPITENTRSALIKIVPRKPIQKENKDDKVEDERRVQTAVMLVKENLETVEFAVHRVPRTLYPQENGIPNSVGTTPKPHQEEAYKWLCDHYKAGSRGVLLADDMGLGKTFQSLMFFSWLREGIENGEISDKPLLIVAPTGLLKNWESEIELHLIRDLGNIVRVYGSELRSLRSGISLNISKLRNAGLVLTTYDTLTRYQTSFGAVSFASVIFDEMQKLKNPGIQNYTAACSLNCDFWIGMTGTPVENRLCDLWSIADVLQPGMLGSIKEFSNKYEKSMLEGGEAALEKTLELQNGLIRQSEKAPAFMLRRMKYEKLPGLPAKNIHEHPTTMPNDQIMAYNQVLSDVRNSENRRGIMLEALHKLRAYSLHPDYKKQQDYVSDEDFIKRSARLQSCFKILDEIHKKNEKALIFIEYNEWHRPEFLRDMIKRRYSLKELPMVINGQVDSAARQSRVDAFQKERGAFDVMLLSPRAGGVGLTLTAANHVIHLTRWWNPAVEDQATDRIYRIGQELPVHIHYPMSIHPDLPNKCFDYDLNNRLNAKRQMSTKVLIAPPGENNMAEELMSGLFNTNNSFEISLHESYSLLGTEFEDITLKRLQRFSESQGFHVRYTPRSWDGGADMIIETMDGQIAAIVQCKHVSKSDKSPDINSDLERAFHTYGCEHNLYPVMKIGITNSSKISKIDTQWEKLSELHLIIYDDNGLKPETIFSHLRERVI